MSALLNELDQAQRTGSAPDWRYQAMADLVETRTAERDAMRDERDQWIARVAALTADLDQVTDRLNLMHGKHSAAMRRALAAESARDDALAQRDALRAERAPQGTTAPSGAIPDDDGEPYALTDIELTRLKRLIRELRADDEERHAVLINRVLSAVIRITEQAKAEAGLTRRNRRVA